MLLEINPINPQPRKINQVVDLLKKGGVIAYPTDTQYGIGCDIMNKKAIERVYQIKQWPKHKPFSFICSDLKNISHYAKVSNYAYKTMRRLLPGPYTFILEGSKQVPKMMLTKRKTAGIRVPDNPYLHRPDQRPGAPRHLRHRQHKGRRNFQRALAHRRTVRQAARYDHRRRAQCLRGPSSVVSLIGDEPEVLREGMGEVDTLV
jgi:tRNA threonylcarbamoyl adenosine modification protein (Sua5/YciO/YrdC/YwlC family)